MNYKRMGLLQAIIVVIGFGGFCVAYLYKWFFGAGFSLEYTNSVYYGPILGVEILIFLGMAIYTIGAIIALRSYIRDWLERRKFPESSDDLD
ncbi:hypothetical protein JO972_12110 [Verrucomicrobiaceae bacterium 5K15]|nr:hypothetical protein [Oceaniferula flavus]